MEENVDTMKWRSESKFSDYTPERQQRSMEYSDNKAFMKSCLNTCIVLGISIGCSIFIVLC